MEIFPEIKIVDLSQLKAIGHFLTDQVYHEPLEVSDHFRHVSTKVPEVVEQPELPFVVNDAEYSHAIGWDRYGLYHTSSGV